MAFHYAPFSADVVKEKKNPLPYFFFKKNARIDLFCIKQSHVTDKFWKKS